MTIITSKGAADASRAAETTHATPPQPEPAGDLVTRLRQGANPRWENDRLRLEAADEIERLDRVFYQIALLLMPGPDHPQRVAKAREIAQKHAN